MNHLGLGTALGLQQRANGSGPPVSNFRRIISPGNVRTISAGNVRIINT